MIRIKSLIVLLLCVFSASSFADITRLEQQTLIFGNAGGFAAAETIVGDTSNPNAEGNGIELLPILKEESYLAKGLNIEGTLVELMPDDWSDEGIEVKDGFQLWPIQGCDFDHINCSVNAEWVYNVPELNLGDLGEVTGNDRFFLAGNSATLSGWNNDKSKSSGSFTPSNFVPSMNLFVGNTAGLMVGLGGNRINSFGIQEYPTKNSGSGTDYLLASQPIRFQSNEANLYIGKRWQAKNQGAWSENTPILTLIPNYSSSDGNTTFEDEPAVVINGTVPATNLTIYGDLQVNGPILVDDFGVNAFDKLEPGDTYYFSEQTKSLNNNFDMVIAEAEFDVYFVTHNIMVLGSASSAAVSSGAHTRSIIYLKFFRVEGTTEIEIDYDSNAGTWSDSSGTSVYSSTANTFRGSYSQSSSNQATFFSARFPGSSLGTTYKVQTILRMSENSNSTGRYYPVSGKVIVAGLPGDTLSGHFSGTPDAALVDVVGSIDQTSESITATYLEDNLLGLSDWGGEDIQTGITAKDSGSKKILNFVEGAVGGLAILRATNVTAHAYYDKTLLRVVPSTPSVNGLVLKDDNDTTGMAIQVLDQSDTTTDYGKQIAYAIKNYDPRSVYDTTYYYESGVTNERQFYSNANVSHNIQGIYYGASAQAATGDIKIGMGNMTVPSGGSPDDYIAFGTADYASVGNASQIQIASGSMFIGGNTEANVDLGDNADVVVEGEITGQLVKMFYSRCMPGTYNSSLLGADAVNYGAVSVNTTQGIKRRMYTEERASLNDANIKFTSNTVSPLVPHTDQNEYFNSTSHAYCLVDTGSTAGASVGVARSITADELFPLGDNPNNVTWKFKVITTISAKTTALTAAFTMSSLELGDFVYFTGDTSANSASNFVMIEEFANCGSGSCLGYTIPQTSTETVAMFLTVLSQTNAFIENGSDDVIDVSSCTQDVNSTDTGSTCLDDSTGTGNEAYYNITGYSSSMLIIATPN